MKNLIAIIVVFSSLASFGQTCEEYVDEEGQSTLTWYLPDDQIRFEFTYDSGDSMVTVASLLIESRTRVVKPGNTYSYISLKSGEKIYLATTKRIDRNSSWQEFQVTLSQLKKILNSEISMIHTFNGNTQVFDSNLDKLRGYLKCLP